MLFENFDEAVLANEKLSLEIPEEAITTPTMPNDISVDTVYVVDGVNFTNPRSQGCPRFQSGEELANSVGKINAC